MRLIRKTILFHYNKKVIQKKKGTLQKEMFLFIVSDEMQLMIYMMLYMTIYMMVIFECSLRYNPGGSPMIFLKAAENLLSFS